MSLLKDIAVNLKKILLIEDKIDRLGDEVKSLRTDVLDHGHRLIRIETMIEMAQHREARSPARIEGPD